MEREVAKLSTLSGHANRCVSLSADMLLVRMKRSTQCRTQLTAQAQRIDESQQHLRRLQQEVTDLIGQSTPRAEQERPESRPRVGHTAVTVGGWNEELSRGQ